MTFWEQLKEHYRSNLPGSIITIHAFLVSYAIAKRIGSGHFPCISKTEIAIQVSGLILGYIGSSILKVWLDRKYSK